MHIGLVIAKLIVVLLGLLITLQGYRAYCRERSQRMLFVAVGFACISVGSVLEGVLYDVVQLSVFVAGMVQTMFVAAGMILILYSLFAGSQRTSRRSSTKREEIPDENVQETG